MREYVAIVAKALLEAKGLLIGEFTLSSGKKSFYYLDLGTLLSKPELLDLISNLVCVEVKRRGVPDYIVGVPYRGLPIAICTSLKLNIPCLMVRKERKEHGTKKAIEGVFKEGCAAIIDDVATTGGSIAKTVDLLRGEGLEVSYALVVVDRMEGARDLLKEKGVELYSLVDIIELADYLLEIEEINDYTYKRIRKQFKI